MIYTKKQLREDLKEYDGVNPFVIPDTYDEIEYECFGNNKRIKSIYLMKKLLFYMQVEKILVMIYKN